MIDYLICNGMQVDRMVFFDNGIDLRRKPHGADENRERRNTISKCRLKPRGNSGLIAKGVAKGVFTRRPVLFFIYYTRLYRACWQFGKWLSQIVCLMSVDSRGEGRWPGAGAGA